VRRLTGALARKGYGPGLTGRVVRAALDEVDDVEDPARDAFGSGADERFEQAVRPSRQRW
jgi:hypothetical protein